MIIAANELTRSLNKAYRLLKPKRNHLNVFKANLLHLLQTIDEKESEENVKIHLMDFLKSTYYHPDYLVATKGRTDFVIHLGKEAKAHAGVLFEVKKPTNKVDMVSKTNLNAKAMHELILYFLRERLINKNNSLTHLVITNIYEWYVFDAALFERVFIDNNQLQKAYKEWESGQKVSTKTDLFYSEIAKPFLQELDKEISFTYFDIRSFSKELKSDNQKDDNRLVPLYKFFTPAHLLKLPFINDSNSLDKGFYSELLHIIGLREYKDGSRKIINRLHKDERHPGSLIENAISIVELETTLRKVPNNLVSGETEDEKIFNFALELCITWVNRILFLKLLEAQLLIYHNNDSKYRFLNIHTIRDFDELYKLFFQVLAKPNSERHEIIRRKYGHIPYLNSSLFEISELEDDSLKINGLDDNIELNLYSNSILKKKIGFKDTIALNTLHYLFEFLDSYDFSSIGKEEIQEENKPIINAAVLGLVFEKINGYRDGSFYTPGAITMFLCRETIRKAVVKKFNDTYSWKCETIQDLRNYLSDRRNVKDVLEFNQVMEKIRIVDPAVGSGHFLVSSLNEVISIKAELGILADSSGNRLSELEVTIANDELVILNRKTDKFFEYVIKDTNNDGSHIISTDTQIVQQALFNEKRKIIENCLFGVDINSNSVKICQLRLWIELLKHAYYKPETGYRELETLPNIDINIKDGNSLLSKFPLSEDLSDVFKKQKFGVADYQSSVFSYKESPDKETKKKLLQFFKSIKDQFRQTVAQRDPRRKKLSELRGQLMMAQNNIDLFGQKRSQEELKQIKEKISASINKLETEIAEIENNVIYQHAFEWRFEFPEVLDSKGNFDGFEVVIGNPPYIQLQKMGESADILEKVGYETFARMGDIYCLFYELAIRLLKPGYYFGFITSSKWMRSSYGEATRKFFIEKTNPLLLVDFSGYQVFDAATVETNLLISQKASYEGHTETCLLDTRLNSLEKMSDFIRQHKRISSSLLKEAGWVVLNEIESTIKDKVESIGIPLKDWDVQINYGIKTGFNEAFIINGQKREELLKKCPKAAEIIRPIIKGRNIKKYKAKFDDLWVIFTRRGIDIDSYPAVKSHLQQFYEDLKPKKDGDKRGRKPGNYKWYEIQDNVAYFEDFYKEKIMWLELTDVPKFAYDNTQFFVEATAFIMTGKHLKFLTAFLNSKLSEWYFDKITTTSGVGTNRWKKVYIESFPIPKLGSNEENKFEIAVDKILKRTDAPTEKLIEDQIDEMVFNLYSFSDEEKQVILDFATKKSVGYS